ncbi:hypothetical protein AArcSt11_10195 [Natranaeroarchaeum aerophilus]|uniref:Right-handed parallel beta-helix repeat-containing protein n=2 Tax=Natranaeroarchaeum aerophilus TaxID=2917711 RepID=A0AAE3FR14_9EURY|nr:hypothetical protein [Natranaeroarchaeum aerophilus]
MATATEIHLGEEGLQEGDDAGAYLANHIGDNREIVIPAGTYQYSTRAFTRGHSSGYADLVVRGEGEFGDVVFEHRDGYSFSEVIAASGGDVLVDNIIWRGVAGGNGNITVRAHGDDEVTLRRIARPDGNHDSGEGVFVRPRHAGVANFEHCWLENFPDNGLYGSAPGGSNGSDGAINVTGGLYKNNNIANIRVGGSNSTIEGATVVLTDQQRGLWGSSRAVNMRGIWIREGTASNGHDIAIRDCDVYNELPYASIEINPRNGGGSGVVENTRVYNEADNPAINHRGGDWSGRENHATGSGNLRIETGTNNCEGSQCDMASDVPRAPIGDRGESPSTSEHPEMEPHLVTFITTEDAPRSEYRFIADGPIEPLTDSPYDSPSGNAVAATSNYVIERDDDRYGAEGSSGNGFGDAFEVYGAITEARVDSPDMVIELDGDRVDADELVERTKPEEKDDDENGGDNDETEGSDDTDEDSSPPDDEQSDSDDDSLSNVIMVDGSESDDVSQYVLTVSGELERSEAHTSIVNEGLAWDTLPSNVSGDRAIGVVGQGTDGYRYSGNVISVEVRGNAALHIDRE